MVEIEKENMAENLAENMAENHLSSPVAACAGLQAAEHPPSPAASCAGSQETLSQLQILVGRLESMGAVKSEDGASRPSPLAIVREVQQNWQALAEHEGALWVALQQAVLLLDGTTERGSGITTISEHADGETPRLCADLKAPTDASRPQLSVPTPGVQCWHAPTCSRADGARPDAADIASLLEYYFDQAELGSYF